MIPGTWSRAVLVLVVVALAALSGLTFVIFATSLVSNASLQCSTAQLAQFRRQYQPCFGSSSNALCSNATCLTSGFAAALPNCRIGSGQSLRRALEAMQDACHYPGYRNAASTCEFHDIEKLHRADSTGVCACTSSDVATVCDPKTSTRVVNFEGYCNAPKCAVYLAKVVDQQPMCAQPEVTLALAMCVNADADTAAQILRTNNTSGSNSTWTIVPAPNSDSTKQPKSFTDYLGALPLVAVTAMAFVGLLYGHHRREEWRRRDSAASTASFSTASRVSFLQNDSNENGNAAVV